jgi:hypothetical protein
LDIALLKSVIGEWPIIETLTPIFAGSVRSSITLSALRRNAAKRGLLLTLTVLLGCGGCTASTELRAAPPSAKAFSFALMGDMPYWGFEEPLVRQVIADINHEPAKFVVHIGDIKNGMSRCSDELFRDRLEMFSHSLHPFIYVPGDNEWTDCHRPSDGGYDPVERLDKLREIFFVDERSLGENSLPLIRQSRTPAFAKYRENVRWQFANVLFVGLNVPGSNNNFGRSADADAEYRERSLANAAWLEAAFRIAKQRKLLGVAIFIQADPDFSLRRLRKPRSGYREFVTQLAAEAAAFKRPVLLAHGDSHRYIVDRPLFDPASGKAVRNVLRVETFGSPTINWVRITVDPDDPQLFRAEPGQREEVPSAP